MTREELFVALALRAKMITEGQLEEARNLQALLLQNGFKLTLPEILTRKEFLNADQVRILNIVLRYEEIREDDLALGAFLVKKGFLPEEKVRDCLNEQEEHYREGGPLTRLRDLLVQKNYLTAPQMQVILRARLQFDPSARPPSTPLPAVLPPPEAPAPAGEAGPGPVSPRRASSATLPVRAEDRPPAPSRAESSARLGAPSESTSRIPLPPGAIAVEAGLAIDHLRVFYRRALLEERPGGGEDAVTVLHIEGSLDGHTFRKFDQYLNAVIEHKGPRLILNCEKLDHVSSAGIGVLAGAAKRCRDLKGDLRLCGVGEKVKKIVHLVGLQSVLRMFEGERGALMSFRVP